MTPPVSGCRRRLRSSAVSTSPATSITTGPSGMDSATALRLEHDARAGEAFLVADRQVVADDPFALDHRGEIRMEREAGLAELVLHDADALERHGVAKTGAHRLRKS